MDVVLDTTLVSGLFSHIGKEKHDQSEDWHLCLEDMVKNLEKPAFIIPAIVFFEYASKGDDTAYFIETVLRTKTTDHPFNLLNKSIDPDLLMNAAWYRRIVCGKEKGGPNFPDALLAAFCYETESALITTNQKDFPPRYFSLLASCEKPTDNEKAPREFVYLLFPNKIHWNQDVKALQKQGERELESNVHS